MVLYKSFIDPARLRAMTKDEREGCAQFLGVAMLVYYGWPVRMPEERTESFATYLGTAIIAYCCGILDWNPHAPVADMLSALKWAEDVESANGDHPITDAVRQKLRALLLAQQPDRPDRPIGEVTFSVADVEEAEEWCTFACPDDEDCDHTVRMGVDEMGLWWIEDGDADYREFSSGPYASEEAGWDFLRDHPNG